MKSNISNKILINIVILVSLFLGISYFTRIHYILKINDNVIVFIQSLYKWLILLIAFFLSKYFSKDNYFSLKEKNYNLFFYIKNIFLFLIILIILNALLGKISLLILPDHTSEKLSLLINTFKKSKFLLLFTEITAGIVEEIIFRGYILGKLLSITKSKSMSILISTFSFSIIHISYGNILSIITTFIFGLMASFYYLKFSNIKIIILVHILWDIIAFSIALNIKN